MENYWSFGKRNFNTFMYIVNQLGNITVTSIITENKKIQKARRKNPQSQIVDFILFYKGKRVKFLYAPCKIKEIDKYRLLAG